MSSSRPKLSPIEWETLAQAELIDQGHVLDVLYVMCLVDDEFIPNAPSSRLLTKSEQRLRQEIFVSALPFFSEYPEAWK